MGLQTRLLSSAEVATETYQPYQPEVRPAEDFHLCFSARCRPFSSICAGKSFSQLYNYSSLSAGFSKFFDHESKAPIDMLLKSLTTGGHDAFAYEGLYLCLVRKVSISGAVLDKLPLGQSPQSLDGVQMTGVGGVVVEDQVVLLRHVCYSRPKVRLEVI